MNLVYGIHPVEILLNTSPDRVLALYYIPRKSPSTKIISLIEEARKRRIPVNAVGPEEAPPGAHPHQGIWARVRAFQYTALAPWLSRQKERTVATLVILDGVTDPQNLGAIIRTASCMGCQGILLPKNRSASIRPAVWKASAGAVAALPILRAINLARTIEHLKREGFWIFGTRAENATPLWEAPWTEKTAIILGSEGKGIRPLLRSRCDFHLAIPMSGQVPSLNVSVAAGMILYERVRWLATHQRKEPHVL